MKVYDPDQNTFIDEQKNTVDSRVIDAMQRLDAAKIPYHYVPSSGKIILNDETKLSEAQNALSK